MVAHTRAYTQSHTIRNADTPGLHKRPATQNLHQVVAIDHPTGAERTATRICSVLWLWIYIVILVIFICLLLKKEIKGERSERVWVRRVSVPETNGGFLSNLSDYVETLPRFSGNFSICPDLKERKWKFLYFSFEFIDILCCWCLLPKLLLLLLNNFLYLFQITR